MTHQIFSPARVGLPLRLLQPTNTTRVQGATGAHLALLIASPSRESHGERNAGVPADITGLARWIDTFEAENQWDSGSGARLVSAAPSARPTS